MMTHPETMMSRLFRNPDEYAMAVAGYPWGGNRQVLPGSLSRGSLPLGPCPWSCTVPPIGIRIATTAAWLIHSVSTIETKEITTITVNGEAVKASIPLFTSQIAARFSQVRMQESNRRTSE
jgi:hypothetical protein